MNIHDFQTKVTELEEIRGFKEETTDDKIEFLVNETVELIKAIQNRENIAEEVVDVFSVLMMIVKREGIDFENAFLSKYENDKRRV